MGVRVEQTKLIVQTRRKTPVWRGPDKLLATHSYTYDCMNPILLLTYYCRTFSRANPPPPPPPLLLPHASPVLQLTVDHS